MNEAYSAYPHESLQHLNEKRNNYSENEMNRIAKIISYEQKPDVT